MRTELQAIEQRSKNIICLTEHNTVMKKNDRLYGLEIGPQSTP